MFTRPWAQDPVAHRGFHRGSPPCIVSFHRWLRKGPAGRCRVEADVSTLAVGFWLHARGWFDARSDAGTYIGFDLLGSAMGGSGLVAPWRFRRATAVVLALRIWGYRLSSSGSRPPIRARRRRVLWSRRTGFPVAPRRSGTSPAPVIRRSRASPRRQRPAGQTVHFKIDTDAAAYTIDIYRIGYYGGDGARLVASVTPSATLPQTQPACITDDATASSTAGTGRSRRRGPCRRPRSPACTSRS